MSFKAILGIVGCCLFLGAASKSSAQMGGPVSVTLGQERDKYNIDGEFTSPVSPKTAWDVLTDYANLSKFVSSIHSHIRGKNGKDFLVHQVAGGGFLFITVSVEVLLEVHEKPFTSIRMKDVSGKDFKSYSGVWGIHPAPGGVHVTYKLKIERNEKTPGFINGDLLRNTTKDLLSQVRKEMERRETKKAEMNQETPVNHAIKK